MPAARKVAAASSLKLASLPWRAKACAIVRLAETELAEGGLAEGGLAETGLAERRLAEIRLAGGGLAGWSVSRLAGELAGRSWFATSLPCSGSPASSRRGSSFSNLSRGRSSGHQGQPPSYMEQEAGGCWIERAQAILSKQS